MVILSLGGGLGNQMFQYAFARKLMRATGDTQLSFSGYRLKNTENRPDMLFQLRLAGEDAEITMCDDGLQQQIAQVQEPVLRELSLRRKFARRCPFLGKLPENCVQNASLKGVFTTAEPYLRQTYKGISVEGDAAWKVSDAVCGLPYKFVVGNFQTYRYWEDISADILSELYVKAPASPENQALAEQMQASESVCVHIRRGDYLEPEYAHLNLCGQAYYAAAMCRMKEQCPDAVFYIFSNNCAELDWIRKNYDFSGYDVRYVDLDNPDYEELRLMYSCRHFIISNSTFSWWGQRLSKNEDKIVIAPKAWNTECRTDGIYMPSWQLVEV